MRLSQIIQFKGFIRDIRYRAYLVEDLPRYTLDTFLINNSAPAGLLETPDGTIGFSKWVSPKRTRSYPFERIYKTYNAPKIITVIPIIKDEGQDGDLDKIQASTISWMNLLNIYIVLGYYDTATKSRRYAGKITAQQLNEAYVRDQIQEILAYKQSALHWNRSLIEDRFRITFEQALDAYESISHRTGVLMHSQRGLRAYAATLQENLQEFWTRSLRASRGAALRESRTIHNLEYLGDGFKGVFELENYLGGTYHLTADEILTEAGVTIIQESKNASRHPFPSLSDIRDGLFKLILFANIDRLETQSGEFIFKTRLKLTGKGINGLLNLPCTDNELSDFLAMNLGMFKKRQIDTIGKLRLEVEHNQKVEVEIRGNL